MFLAAMAMAMPLSLQSTAAKAPPKDPAAPFSVYVFARLPSGPDDGDSIGRTTEEVQKKVKDRKKWFRVVESREEADLAIEVLGQSTSESATQNFVTRTDNTDSPDRQMAAFGDVQDTHILVTLVHVPKGEPIEMRVESAGRRPRDAAKPFALRLETFCRQNYWTLMEALGK